MSRLILIIGFDSPKPSAAPHSVYVGRDGEAAIKAMDSSTAARFEIFRNPIGQRKNNPRAGVVDVEASRADMDKEDREAVEQYEKDLGDAFQRGGNAAAKHFMALIGELPEGAHPDEIKPRGATWLAERANWVAEVEAQRQHIANLEAALKPALPVDNTAPLALETPTNERAAAPAPQVSGLSPQVSPSARKR